MPPGGDIWLSTGGLIRAAACDATQLCGRVGAHALAAERCFPVEG